MKRFLIAGLFAGLAAGAAAALFAATVGRGPTLDAIAFEEEASHESGMAHHDELFSGGVQELGGAVGLIVFGVGLGVIFAVVLAAVGSRTGATSPMGASLRLALAGFITIVVVPFIKYPPNTPGVSDPDTINERTLLYFALLAGSILLTLAVWTFCRSTSLQAVPRAWATAAIYGAGLAAMLLILPDVTPLVEAPAELVWRFRLASLGGLASAWAMLGLVTGSLLTRSLAASPVPATVA